MKLRYRIIILLAIFIISLMYFSKNYLNVRSFDITKSTTTMSEATLPNISMQVGEEEINLLYGYTSNLDEMLIRETITPLTTDQTFSILIAENESIVRKMKYEIFDVTTGDIFDSGTISALSKEDDRKTAKIKIKGTMIEGTEYAVKITLITSTSKRIYYYTRVKVYAAAHMTEKLDYVDWFHTSILNKQNEEAIKKNLETKANADTTSFARVSIYSNWDMVSWGNLKPTVVYEMVPTITDFYEGTASVVRSFVVSVKTDSGLEYYLVRENYRFLYTDIRMYLYSYEREMEAIYDVDLTSISGADLKLGITADTDMELFTTGSNQYTAFVRERELWCYNQKENTMSCVFSFRQKETDYVLDLYDSHNVQILNMDEEGNIDFVVYGYMNRGEYEGRVAIILYRYISAENRIEEQAYFPMTTTYQILEGEKNSFIYMNQYDVLYITIYDTIYTYNLTTHELNILEENVPDENVVFSAAKQRVAWQEDPDETTSRNIIVMNLEEGTRSTISAGADEVIKVLGSIDENIIYGVAKQADVVQNSDGTATIPMYKLNIVDFDGTVLKEYEKEGIYVTNASVNENVIELQRVKKRDTQTLGYEVVESDAIQNRTADPTATVNIVSRLTDLTLTEYYISFPANFTMAGIPRVIESVNTVIEDDTTVRVTESESRDAQYMTYSFGRVILVTTSAAQAIELANVDESVGAVIENHGKLVWERGVKKKSGSITGITPIFAGDSMTSLQASLKMIFANKGLDVDTSGFTFDETSIGDWLSEYMNMTPVNLKDSTLDEVLYYVHMKRPVIAVIDSHTTLLIYGYNSSDIEVVDPALGTTRKIPIKDAELLFEESGNQFFSYID